MGLAMDGMQGAIEVHMEAGDVVVFVDSLAHGSVRRTNLTGTHDCVMDSISFAVPSAVGQLRICPPDEIH